MVIGRWLGCKTCQSLAAGLTLHAMRMQTHSGSRRRCRLDAGAAFTFAPLRFIEF